MLEYGSKFIQKVFHIANGCFFGEFNLYTQLDYESRFHFILRQSS